MIEQHPFGFKSMYADLDSLVFWYRGNFLTRHGVFWQARKYTGVKISRDITQFRSQGPLSSFLDDPGNEVGYHPLITF